MSYYIYWLLLIMISIWVSLAAFFWALRHGQFSEQDRARYLPFRNEVSPPLVARPSKPTREVYALLGILCMGVLIMVVVLIKLFLRSGGR